MHTWGDGGKNEGKDQDSTKTAVGWRKGEGFAPVKWEIEEG